MKIQKLQNVRLVLIVTAVFLVISVLAVWFLWIPSEAAPAAPVTETTATTAATAPPDTTPETAIPEIPEVPETDPTLPDPNNGDSQKLGDNDSDADADADDDADTDTDTDADTDTDTDADADTDADTDTDKSKASGTFRIESYNNGLLSENGEGEGSTTAPDEFSSETVPGASEPQPQETTVPDSAPAGNDMSGKDNDLNNPAWAGKTTGEDGTAENGGSKKVEKKARTTGETVFIVLCVLLCVDICALVIVCVLISKAKNQAAIQHAAERVCPTAVSGQTDATMQTPPITLTVGQLHNIGARPYQEDAFGTNRLDDGILAVVADGMGGLSGGDKVSQKIVQMMLGYSDKLRPGVMDGVLDRMVYGTNEAVNAMLGPDGLYKSGSTLLAVLVRQNRFNWITVGDSHIYYYHAGRLTRLNEEHTRGRELLQKAARGEITYEEARNDPRKNGLTSFIGMGKLKYVDRSLESLPLFSGDRILLMSDGVFNAVPDETIAAVLAKCPDVKVAAAELERLVIQRGNPRQDNFTAVILGF